MNWLNPAGYAPSVPKPEQVAARVGAASEESTGPSTTTLVVLAAIGGLSYYFRNDIASAFRSSGESRDTDGAALGRMARNLREGVTLTTSDLDDVPGAESKLRASLASNGYKLKKKTETLRDPSNGEPYNFSYYTASR